MRTEEEIRKLLTKYREIYEEDQEHHYQTTWPIEKPIEILKWVLNDEKKRDLSLILNFDYWHRVNEDRLKDIKDFRDLVALWHKECQEKKD